METMLNSKPNAQLLPSASHDDNTMLADGEFVSQFVQQNEVVKFVDKDDFLIFSVCSIKELLPIENRTSDKINETINNFDAILNKVGTNEKLLCKCFINVVKYLGGNERSILEVPKEIRMWFKSEFGIS